MKQRKKGETYRPVATVQKLHKGVPSVLLIAGRRYVLDTGTRK